MRQRFGIAIALLANPKLVLVIVDEPTAGLHPAERVRFLDLLGDLGEDTIVILSTHIVEDVSELCRRMAIIDNGEIVLEPEPLGAIEELRGRIWRRMVPKGELPNVERERAVIATTTVVYPGHRPTREWSREARRERPDTMDDEE